MSEDNLPSRVARLEDGVDRLVSAVDKQGDRFDSKLDSISTSINLLVRIDERQIGITERLQAGAATMSGHEKRLSDIETSMPGLRELRAWVVTGITAGAGLICLGVMKLLGVV